MRGMHGSIGCNGSMSGIFQLLGGLAVPQVFYNAGSIYKYGIAKPSHNTLGIAHREKDMIFFHADALFVQPVVFIRSTVNAAESS
jgi:hypothetical protein